MKFVRNIRTYNVDEIDHRKILKNENREREGGIYVFDYLRGILVELTLDLYCNPSWTFHSHKMTPMNSEGDLYVQIKTEGAKCDQVHY